jgi:hypothetical protein
VNFIFINRSLRLDTVPGPSVGPGKLARGVEIASVVDLDEA